MRRVTALLCAVALIVVMAAAAPSAFAAKGGDKGPTSKPGAALKTCVKSGGQFVDVSPLVYACVFPNDSRPQRRNQARRICQKRGGLFVDVSPLVYACVLPGGTLPQPLPSPLG